MNLYFTYESRGTLKSFTLFSTVKTTTKLNLGHSDKFEIEILKISHRRSCSSDSAELSHFTLLFCRGRQRNVPKIITACAQLLFCSLNLLFSNVPVAVAVVVILRSLPSDDSARLRKIPRWKVLVRENTCVNKRANGK